MYETVAERTDEKEERDWCIGQRWIDMMTAYSFGSRVRSDRESSRQRSMEHVRSSRWMLAACASISWPWQTMAGDRARAWATGVHTVVCHSIVIFFFFLKFHSIVINSVARVLQVDLQKYAHAGVQDVQRRSMLMRSTRSTQVRMHSQIKWNKTAWRAYILMCF